MKTLNITRSASKVAKQAKNGSALFLGDCLDLVAALPSGSIDIIITSPPYCIGKEYESTSNLEDFEKMHSTLLPEVVRILKPGGSLCWQVGNHVQNNKVTPLDCLIFAEMRSFKEVSLRNRIIWNYGHGLHCSNRFSGRHETIMWYTKGDKYTFNLDDVRVPQKYPGKTYTKGPNKGKPSGNPRGKNPSDVWEIPNVKSNHIEKTDHPCQFPVALPQILIKALSNEGDIVLDPFLGSGSTAVAAVLENRRYVGAETDEKYIKIAQQRINDALSGVSRTRPWDKAIEKPNPKCKVAQLPDGHFVYTDAQLDISICCS